MRHILYILLLCICWITGMAQETLTGKVVTSRGGIPLIGATVRVKDTQLTVQTDVMGLFTLNMNGKQIHLLISMIGYATKEVKVVTPLKSELEVFMEEKNLQLTEVEVSTGYQDIPKERATGSFSKIDRELFNEQQSTTIMSRLEAIGNSISVDRRTTGSTGGISIRGISTIQGIGGPLIVLDNFPYEGDLSNLNPNEVESISFLKDAAASSIWGAKAGNGVIVITTKKGKLNTPFRADLSIAYTLGAKPDLFYQELMSTADYIDFERSAFEKGYYDAQIISTSKPALSPVVELLLHKRNGQISSAAVDVQLNDWKRIDVRNEVIDKVYKPLLNQQYSLNLQGGSKAYAWLFSGGYDNNKDNLSSRYGRYNLRYQHNWTVVKGLQLNSDLYYTSSNNDSGNTAYNSYSVLNNTGLYPYAQLATSEGNALPVAKNYSLSYLATGDKGRLLDWKYYPLTDYLYDTNNRATQDMVANFGARYEIFKNLSVELKYRFERQLANTVSYQNANSYVARNIVNLFTQLSDKDAVYKVPMGGVRTENNAQLRSEDLRGQLNYQYITINHEVALIVGAERRNANNITSTYRKYGFQDETWKSGSVDYLTAFPSFVTGSSQFIPNVDGLSGITNRFISVYTNGAYTYKKRYMLSLSGRSDASNLYGVNTNDKWNPLWSSGLGWKVSDEPFYKSDFIPYLKVRATYGVSGNTDQGKSAISIISFVGTNPYTGTGEAKIEKFANPELRWEKVKMFNVGLDFQIKGDRLKGSIDYFEKRGLDLFGSDILDYTGGAGNSIVKNVAKMKGRGIDIELNSVNIKGLLQWTSQLNFSVYRDQISTYYITSFEGSRFIGTSGTIGLTGIIGKPVYSIFSYKWAGLDPLTGDPRGYIKGVISKDYTALTGSGTQLEDLVYHGSALPTLYGSMGNTLSYKGLNLTFRLMYKFGYYFRNAALTDMSLYSGKVASSQYSERWQKPGDELDTDVPSIAYPYSSSRDAFYSGSEVNIQKGDHIRLQYITLGYNLNKRMFKQLPVNAIHFFLNIDNVGLLWKATKENVDPGYPVNNIKEGRTVSIGLRSNF